MRLLKVVVLALTFLAPFALSATAASGVVAPSWIADQSVSDDYINVSATLSCSNGNTNKQIDANAVAFSVSSTLGAPQTSGIYDARGGQYVAWSASWIRPAIGTQQAYSVQINVTSGGVVCDNPTGFTGVKDLSVVVGPLVVRNADLQIVSNGSLEVPDVVVYWWGGTAQAMYQVEYQFNSAGWQYFYTGSDSSRSFLNLQNGRHSFRVKAKRGSIESPTWTESSIQVGSVATPTPTPTATPTATPTPTVTIAPTAGPIVVPSAPTTVKPTVPTPKPSSTALPTIAPSSLPSAPTPTVVVANKSVTGFTGKTLTTTIKKSLTALVKQHAVASHAICTGYYKSASQLATVKAQAVATCAYLKSQDKTLITSVATAKSSKTVGVQVSFKK